MSFQPLRPYRKGRIVPAVKVRPAVGRVSALVPTSSDGAVSDDTIDEAEHAEPESDMPSKQKRTRLEKLQNSWTKATAEERFQFLVWLRQANISGDASNPSLCAPPIASGRYLLPSAIARIRAVMADRGLAPADVMVEIGFEMDDPSLARALDGNASLRLAVVAALEIWLVANSSAAAS